MNDCDDWRDDRDYDRMMADDGPSVADDDDSELGICQACNGSGEGQHEGSVCQVCHGWGEV
jgi:hypothetical protein